MKFIKMLQNFKKNLFFNKKRISLISAAILITFPLIVFAVSNFKNKDIYGHLLRSSKNGSCVGFKKHIIKQGETISDISKYYHISTDYLKKINSSEGSFNDLTKLKEGDEIYVPNDVSLNNKENKINFENNNIFNKSEIANIISQAGPLLLSENKDDKLNSLAKELLANKINYMTYNWFNKFGKTKLQFTLDKTFSLKNSKFNFLFPLYETNNSLFFTEGLYHYTDDRYQVNFGGGWRYFKDNYMFGLNSFFDEDISYFNSRAGFGVEFWRDYIKLSSNSYFGLSDWKDSKIKEGFQERPASGWDIQAEGYLPVYPNIGAKVIYEKYFGNTISSMNDELKDRNPYSLSAGFTYTPFPLLTFGIKEVKNELGEMDSKFDLEFNYHIGEPWKYQIDSDVIKLRNHVYNNRYDFVNRNNDITFEYRKNANDGITIELPKIIEGFSKEEKLIDVIVNSKYGLNKIKWTAVNFKKNGGKIVKKNNTQYYFTLPKYNYGKNKNNSYLISAVAYNKKNIASNVENIKVNVIYPKINLNYTKFLPEKSTIIADKKSKQDLILNIKDDKNKGIDISENDIDIKVDNGSVLQINSKISKLKKISLGKYSLTVSSGLKSEKLILTPYIKGITLTKAEVNIIPGDQSIKYSYAVSDPSVILADGNSSAKLIFKARDINNNPISKLSVTNKIDSDKDVLKNLIISDWKEEKNEIGTYSSTIKGKIAGLLNIMPQVDGKNAVLNTIKLKLIAVPIPDAKYSIIKVDPTKILADGKDSTKISFIPKDLNGNVIYNLKNVSFVAIGIHTNIHVTNTIEEDGLYTSNLTTTDIGSFYICPTIKNAVFESIKVNLHTIKKNSELFYIKSIVSDKKTIVAGDKKGITYKAKVVDKNNNDKKNIKIYWKEKNVKGTYNYKTSVTNSNGIAKINFKVKDAGKFIVNAYIDKENYKESDEVDIIPTKISLKNSKFFSDKNNISFNGIDFAILKVNLIDIYGNKISNREVKIELLNSSKGFKISSNPMIDLGNGEYYSKITSIEKCEEVLKATVDGEKIGSNIHIIASSVTPNLYFEKNNQNVVYTKNFKKSQKVNGIPLNSNLIQTWRSSDPTVVVVNKKTGELKLKKSGKAKITVNLSGNDFYNPSEISYNINIKKADPGLYLIDHNITSTWGDNSSYTIKAYFKNKEAENLKIYFSSSNNKLVDVDENGIIKTIKPGNIVIFVNTKANSKFNASKDLLVYKFNKKNVPIVFEKNIVNVDEMDTIKVQSTKYKIPFDDNKINYFWESDNKSVVSIKANGDINKINKGEANLILNISDNEYYNGTSGKYKVIVHTIPVLNLQPIKYRGLKKMQSGKWTPVFEDDNITQEWDLIGSDSFSKSKIVIATLRDENDNILDKKIYNRPNHLIKHEAIFKAKPTYWDKRLHVSIMSIGMNNSKVVKSSKHIYVSDTPPHKFWDTFKVVSHVTTHNYWRREESCRESYLGYQHWADAFILNDSVILFEDFHERQEDLMTSFKLTYSLEGMGDASNPINTSMGKDNFTIYRTSVEIGGVDGMPPAWLLDENCWRDHFGGYKVVVTINFGNREYLYKGDWHYFYGDGRGMYYKNIDQDFKFFESKIV